MSERTYNTIVAEWDLDGVTVMECVTPHNYIFFAIKGGDDDHGCACAECAPHEQLGPLPGSFRARLARRTR